MFYLLKEASRLLVRLVSAASVQRSALGINARPCSGVFDLWAEPRVAGLGLVAESVLSGGEASGCVVHLKLTGGSEGSAQMLE